MAMKAVGALRLTQECTEIIQDRMFPLPTQIETSSSQMKPFSALRGIFKNALKSLRTAYFHFPHTLKAKCSLTETSSGQMKPLSALRGIFKNAVKSLRTAYFHFPHTLKRDVA